MKSFFALAILLMSSQVFGRQNYQRPQRLYIPKDYINFTQNRSAYTEIIPSNLAPTQNEAAVFNRFADRGVQLFFTSDQMKTTPLGRTADSVQNTLKTDFEAVSEQTKHHFSFQLLAWQNTAQFKYSGWVDAVANIGLSDKRSELEFTSKVNAARTLFLNHASNPDYTSTLAGMRVNF